MADNSFGIKTLNLVGLGTPKIESLGDLNLNAVNVAISTNATVGGTLNVGGAIIGDGSGLTGIVGSGSGVVVQHDGSNVGTAGTINFSTNLDVTAIHSGITTITASGGVASTSFINAQNLNVTGLSTFVGLTTFRSDIHIMGNQLLNINDALDFRGNNGGNSFITNYIDTSGGALGNLYIGNLTGDVEIDASEHFSVKTNTTEQAILATQNGSVALYHDGGNKKLETSGVGVTITGTLSATSFSGDGSGLTGIVGSGSGVVVKDGGTTVGTAGTINFGTDLSVSSISAGIVTVTSTSSGLQSRQQNSGSTGSIGAGTTANLTITTAKTYALHKIQTSHAAWVTVYTDTTSRTNDASRLETTDPTPGSGVVAEVIVGAATTQILSPSVVGFNNDTSPSTNTYLKVVNKTSGSANITVTLHYVQLES